MHWERRGMEVNFILGQSINLAFYVLEIKIDAYGAHPSHVQHNLRHHVSMQFNKIPTTSYAMQQEMGA